jgi:hypothetical protein
MRLAYGAASVLTAALAMTLATSARAQLQPPPTLQQPYPQPYPPQYPQQYPQTYPQQSPQQQQWGQTVTQQQLDNSIKQDSGRGFEIAYLNAEAGGGYMSLGSGLGLDKASSGGAMVGVGAGVRFITWTLGARFRLLPMSAFTAWQLNGEAGFHLPVGSWDPYANLHVGYVKASANDTTFDVPSPHGLDLGISIGSDYYLSALFSLGIDATADALFLKRAASTAAGSPLTSDASSTGVAVIGSLHAGLHFDL